MKTKQRVMTARLIMKIKKSAENQRYANQVGVTLENKKLCK